MSAIDWSKWLPPEPLPDTGSKVFKPGQVWACWLPNAFGSGQEPCVKRILDVYENGDVADVEHLAGNHKWGPMKDAPNALHAVLVADVGQQPISPRVLYHHAPPPEEEALLLGGFVAGILTLALG